MADNSPGSTIWAPKGVQGDPGPQGPPGPAGPPGPVGQVKTANETITVPTDYATIPLAMAYLKQFVIASSAVITIKVLDGTYTPPTTIVFDHSQMDRIEVIGNEANPDAVVFTVASTATYSLFYMSGNVSLRKFSGFRITRPIKAELPYNTIAFTCDFGASANIGLTTSTTVKIDNWFYGVAARYGGVINCPYIIVDKAGDVGIWAFCGGDISCDNAKSTNANAAGQPWGFGIQGEYGGTVRGINVETSGCKIGGVASLSNSVCRMENLNTHDNLGSGTFVRDGGLIETLGASTSTNNTRYGSENLDGTGQTTGTITYSGNVIAAVNPFASFGVSGGQARVFSNTGPLRLDTSGTGPIYLNTSGGLQLEVTDTPSAVNHWKVTGSSAGGILLLTAVGADTNIAGQVTTKGTGSFFVVTGGGKQMEVYDTPSAVNFPVISGGIAGSPINIGASGTDSVIDLRLNTKGGGYVRFGTFVAGGDAASNGTVTIRDAGGTLRKVMITA